MDNTEKQETTPASVEVAAGGVIWSDQAMRKAICIVHRTKYQDWTLPKGRQNPGEMLEVTARREAMEESGQEVVLRRFAGSYGYTKGGAPKVVLVWHMTKSAVAYTKAAGKDEILEVCWLPPKEAVGKLTHQGEQDFVRLHCLREPPAAARAFKKSEPEYVRLAARINTARQRLDGYIATAEDNVESWWAECAGLSLNVAQSALVRGDKDGGWVAVHDAERFMVFGMPPEELFATAASLAAETEAKLKGWRGNAAGQLFSMVSLGELVKSKALPEAAARIDLLRHVVVKALEVLNEDSDNTYHRMFLVGKQLRTLVGACATLLAATFGMSYWYAPETDFGVESLAPVALAGAFGGVVSAMYQLSRVGQAKIPAALLHGLITSGRPLVGASAALFIYTVTKSGLVSLVDAANITLATSIVLGFVAGCSEQFVLSTVAKVAGSDKSDAEK